MIQTCKAARTINLCASPYYMHHANSESVYHERGGLPSGLSFMRYNQADRVPTCIHNYVTSNAPLAQLGEYNLAHYSKGAVEVTEWQTTYKRINGTCWQGSVC